MASDSVRPLFLLVAAEPRTEPILVVFSALYLQFFGPSKLLQNSPSRMFAPSIVFSGSFATFYSNISKDSFNAWRFTLFPFEKYCGSLIAQ